MLLSVRGLGKTYANPVLEGVDLDLPAGEVHALVGENGAGKSTLSRLIAGLTPPTAGTMTWRGAPFAPASRSEAEAAGVCMVMQELNLIPNLTVAENLLFDRLPHRWGWVDRPRLRAAAREALDRVGLADLDPDCPIQTLGVGQQQMVEIAAGLSRQCALLILDEPTAALTEPESEQLFDQVARLKAAGTSILYISHRLEEIQRLADRITVLRDGRLVATRPAAELNLEAMVRLMVGRETDPVFERASAAPGAELLRVEDLRCGAAVRGVSFELRRGEILGFAGLMGSGRTETMRALFGADERDGGRIWLRGQPAALRSPSDCVRAGMALLTENRKEQGLLLPWPVRANITLAALRGLCRRGGWIDAARERAAAARWGGALAIRCASLEQPVAELSGGNQQKAIIARWLLRDCDLLVFDEPTRGIDVGAKFEIYQWLARLAGQGKGIIVVSSELKELLGLCDRIAVMSAGRLAATFRRGEWTRDKIMAAALSGHVTQEIHA